MPHRISLAADGLSIDEVIMLSNKIGKCHSVKIHDLVDSTGPVAIKILKSMGVNVWVDFKLHDIPATVSKRAMAHKNNGADIVTVHASGGIPMMRAAVETGIKVYAVTILTSLEEYEVPEIYGKCSSEKVPGLAILAKKAGCHGIVCSPLEVASLAKIPELKGMEFITPGVRSLGIDNNDQKRVDTPVSALKNGATCLVIGRQITEAKNPKQAFQDLLKEIDS